MIGFFFRFFYSWKTVKGPMLLYLQSNTWAPLSFLMSAGKRDDTPGSEKKDLIIHGNSSSHSTSTSSCLLPGPNSNRKMWRGAGDLSTLSRFCYRNTEIRKPDSGFRRKAVIASHDRYRNAKGPWNWLHLGITGLGLIFQVQMVELLPQVKTILWKIYK